MTVFGISMVRDEADIIRTTIMHMREQVDEIIVADNGSVDGTRDILNDLGVTVVDDDERGYYQSRKMTALAHQAREKGADWVIPFDADELWFSNQGGRIADVLDHIGEQWLICSAPLFDHVATGNDDPTQSNPIRRLLWRRKAQGAMPKVACRTREDLVIGMGNHDATYGDDIPTIRPELLHLHHYPYRSPEQFIKKVRNGAQAYALSDLPEYYGAHWRDYGKLLDAHGPKVLEDVFYMWFWVKHPDQDSSLVLDPPRA